MAKSLLHDFEDLKRAIDEHPVVSFDVFDTLLVRPFGRPLDLFRLLEATLVSRDGRYVGFARERVAAEDAARRSAGRSGFEEITLDEIYVGLTEVFRREGLDHIDDAMSLELELERRLCRSHPHGLRLLDYARSQRKRILFISDIYLPREAMVAMLEGASISLDGVELVISSEHRLAKHSGNLFRWILPKLDVDEKDLVHFGDNLHSDLDMPRAAGIDAFVTKTMAFEAFERFGSGGSRLYDIDLLWQSVSVGMFGMAAADGDADAIPEAQRYWYHLGYKLVAPMAISVAYWVRDQAIADGVEKILFLARDGEIVKLVYDALFANDPSAPPSEYVYASRRMLSLVFGTVNDEHLGLYFEDLLKFANTVEAFTSRVPGGDELASALAAAGFQPQLSLEQNPTNRKLVAEEFRKNVRFILEALAHERDDVRAYLETVVGDLNRIAVFDIGWRGTLQRSIEVALAHRDLKVSGLYFGLADGAKVAGDLSRIRGFAIDKGKPVALANSIYSATALFELFFYGTHPSLQTVRRESNSFVPVYVDQGPQEDVRTERAKWMHRAALAHVQRLVRTFSSRELRAIFDRDDVINGVLKFADEPAPADAREFVGMTFASAIGDDIGSPLIDAAVRDPRSSAAAVERSHWKRGAEMIAAPALAPMGPARAVRIVRKKLRQFRARLRTR